MHEVSIRLIRTGCLIGLLQTFAVEIILVAQGQLSSPAFLLIVGLSFLALAVYFLPWEKIPPYWLLLPGLLATLLAAALIYHTGNQSSHYYSILFYLVAFAAVVYYQSPLPFLGGLSFVYVADGILTSISPLHNLYALAVRFTIYTGVAAITRAHFNELKKKTLNLSQTLTGMENINLDLIKIREEIDRKNLELKKNNIELTALVEKKEALVKTQEQLHYFTKDIISELDLNKIMSKAIEQAAGLLGIGTGLIALWNEENNSLEINTSMNLPIKDTRIRMEKLPDLMGSGTPIITEPKQILLLPSTADLRFGLAVAAPMRYGQGFLGVIIMLTDGREASLSKDQIMILSLLTDILAIATANATLFRQVTQLVEQMITLNEISQNLSSSLNINDLLNNFVEKINSLLKTDAVFIHIWNEEKRRFVLGSATGFKSPPKILRSVRTGEGLIGWIAENNQMVETPNIEESQGYEELKMELGFNYFLAVPLIAGGKVIGVLGCLSKQARRLKDNEITLLLAVLNTASVSIENALLYEKTEKMARFDELTGLYNYRELHHRLDEELERAARFKHSLALLMIDVDNFKDYNDNNGHDQGDAALREIGNIIKRNSRQLDKGFRYGGEEFCLLLLETTPKVALEIAERVRRHVAEAAFPGEDKQPSGNLTVSIGLTIYPLQAADKDELISLADRAMYKAKRAGKNRVMPFAEEFNAA